MRQLWRLPATTVAAALVAGLVTASPALADSTVTIADPDLATCIAKELRKPSSTRKFTASALGGIANLACGDEDDNGRTLHIRSLAGAQHLTSAERLNLSFSEIADFSPLGGLTQLTSVVVQNGRVDDRDLASLGSAVTGLPNLAHLILEGNQITNLAPLAGLTNLRELGLFDNRISDLSPLAGLTGLDQLDLTQNRISSLGSLTGLPNLRSIALGRNSITDVAPLARLTHLVNVDLQDTRVTDPTPLLSLSALRYLSLSGNGIADVSGFASFRTTGLTTLDLSGNKIRDASALSSLNTLTSLFLDNNRLTDLGPLSRLTGLTQLGLGSACDDKKVCSGNLITDVTPLAKLTRLTKLNLGRNQISDVTPLAKLSHLTLLDVSENRISDISPLGRLAYRPDGGISVVAEDQAPVFSLRVGSTVPLKGWKGALPKLGTLPKGLHVVNGRAVATLPGTQKVAFSAASGWSIWSGKATVKVQSSATVASKLKVALDASIKNHAKKGKVTLTLSAGRRIPTGKIQIVDGTKLVKTVSLTAERKGKLTTTLSKLSKGTHTLVFIYKGTGTIKPTVTKVKVKVK